MQISRYSTLIDRVLGCSPLVDGRRLLQKELTVVNQVNATVAIIGLKRYLEKKHSKKEWKGEVGK